MAERSQTAPEAGLDMGNDDAIRGNVSKYVVLPTGYCGQPKKGHLIFDACFESASSILQETDSDKMELYDLSDRYFKVTVIKIFTKIKKMLHEPSENFNKDINNTESSK
ncbi:unnamed protein product [Rangifer tarandus platyrhynchus]|uniref:Uncharacterized protein n=2 Tax=Rangifer tarandus platyrhynchus TaxID=3082113 RepID=A0AC59Y363_RANTA|nr:unnamed protein product [Rangifer tarandus platyrhynchus]